MKFLEIDWDDLSYSAKRLVTAVSLLVTPNDTRELDTYIGFTDLALYLKYLETGKFNFDASSDYYPVFEQIHNKQGSIYDTAMQIVNRVPLSQIDNYNYYTYYLATLYLVLNTGIPTPDISLDKISFSKTSAPYTSALFTRAVIEHVAPDWSMFTDAELEDIEFAPKYVSDPKEAERLIKCGTDPKIIYTFKLSVDELKYANSLGLNTRKVKVTVSSFTDLVNVINSGAKYRNIEIKNLDTDIKGDFEILRPRELEETLAYFREVFTVREFKTLRLLLSLGESEFIEYRGAIPKVTADNKEILRTFDLMPATKINSPIIDTGIQRILNYMDANELNVINPQQLKSLNVPEVAELLAAFKGKQITRLELMQYGQSALHLNSTQFFKTVLRKAKVKDKRYAFNYQTIFKSTRQFSIGVNYKYIEKYINARDKGILQKVQSNSRHPNLPTEYLTLGWLRYNIFGKNIWIDEIQSDLLSPKLDLSGSTVLEFKNVERYLLNFFVAYFKKKKFKRFFLPDIETKHTLYKAKPPVSVYKDVPKKARFVKKDNSLLPKEILEGNSNLHKYTHWELSRINRLRTL